MKEKILKNWSLKLLSLIFAFVIWFIVVQVTDPQITKSFDIPIEFKNSDFLTKNGQVAHVVGDGTVTIKVQKARSIMSTLDEDDFKAVADYSQMYRDTQVPVKVTSLSDKVLDSEIEQDSLSVAVSLEDLQTVTKVIEYETTGIPAAGYVVGNVTTSPSSVTVTCPESFVQYVNKAMVTIDVSDLNEATTVSAELKLYDGNGIPIEVGTGDVSWDSNGIVNCSIELLQIQTVTIDAQITDTDKVASGFIYTGYTVSPSKITISGLRGNISPVTSITVKNISAKGLNTGIERDIDIRAYLPEGVEVYKDSTIIKVKINIEEIAEKDVTIPAASIKTENTKDSYNYTVSEPVTVTVRGPRSMVDALSASDITASVDMDGLRKGTHSVTVKCSFASEYLSVAGRKNVPVVVKEK
ncbi:MAG: hypothetical protein IKR26_04000 [Lachnospiraceae bacterium]|nr:hypothetical protein [Lachnospiraceae bacterium]